MFEKLYVECHRGEPTEQIHLTKGEVRDILAQVLVLTGIVESLDYRLGEAEDRLDDLDETIVPLYLANKKGVERL
jgi:hypothetical protein